MQLTIAAWDDRIFPVELDSNETVATLMAILEAESGLPAAQQQLVHNGRPLPPTANGQGLTSLGILDGDMLMLVPAQQGSAAPAGGQGQQGQQQRRQDDPMMELEQDGSAKHPAAFIQAIKAKADVMGALQHNNPTLFAAIRNEDITAMQVSA